MRWCVPETVRWLKESSDLKSHLTGSGEDTDADIEVACKDTEVNNTIPFESLEQFNILKHTFIFYKMGFWICFVTNLIC